MTADFIPRSNEQGFRSSPTYGPFGAAIAAGHLLGLDEEQATHAIGYAATFAAGTFEGGDGTDIMVLQVSQAARSGLLAAYLAEQGARASATSLEGPIGFYYAFTGGTEGIAAARRPPRLALGDHGRHPQAVPHLDVQPAADPRHARPDRALRPPPGPDRVGPGRDERLRDELPEHHLPAGRLPARQRLRRDQLRRRRRLRQPRLLDPARSPGRLDLARPGHRPPPHPRRNRSASPSASRSSARPRSRRWRRASPSRSRTAPPTRCRRPATS